MSIIQRLIANLVICVAKDLLRVKFSLCFAGVIEFIVQVYFIDYISIRFVAGNE